MRRKSTRSHGEDAVNNYLLEHNINFVREMAWVECRSDKDKLLRFDFYLPDLNIVIEYQGQHHYKPINKYRRAASVHRRIVINDQVKRDFCNKFNIKLIEICYLEFKNISTILDELILQPK